MVGEYVVGEDPDCERGSCSPPIQKFGVEKVILHDKWDSSRRGFRKGNDIALVRLDGLITMFTVSNVAMYHSRNLIFALKSFKRLNIITIN